MRKEAHVVEHNPVHDHGAHAVEQGVGNIVKIWGSLPAPKLHQHQKNTHPVTETGHQILLLLPLIPIRSLLLLLIQNLPPDLSNHLLWVDAYVVTLIPKIIE